MSCTLSTFPFFNLGGGDEINPFFNTSTTTGWLPVCLLFEVEFCFSKTDPDASDFNLLFADLLCPFFFFWELSLLVVLFLDTSFILSFDILFKRSAAFSELLLLLKLFIDILANANSEWFECFNCFANSTFCPSFFLLGESFIFLLLLLESFDSSGFLFNLEIE